MYTLTSGFGRIHVLRAVAAFGLIGLNCACTTVQVDSGGGSTIFGIGVVRVELPPTKGDTLAIERSGVGLGWESTPGGGVWLGYSASEWVIADPADCQMLVIIRSPTQAENAKRILESLEGETPCVVDHTGTLQP